MCQWLIMAVAESTTHSTIHSRLLSTAFLRLTLHTEALKILVHAQRLQKFFVCAKQRCKQTLLCCQFAWYFFGSCSRENHLA